MAGLAGAAAAATAPAAGPTHAQARGVQTADAVVRHRSGFTAQAPRGFRLSFRRGLYTIRNGGRS